MLEESRVRENVLMQGIGETIMLESCMCISKLKSKEKSHDVYSPSPNVSTTPIMAMGCWQCLSLSVV